MNKQNWSGVIVFLDAYFLSALPFNQILSKMKIWNSLWGEGWRGRLRVVKKKLCNFEKGKGKTKMDGETYCAGVRLSATNFLLKTIFFLFLDC